MAAASDFTLASEDLICSISRDCCASSISNCMRASGVLIHGETAFDMSVCEAINPSIRRAIFRKVCASAKIASAA